MYKVKPTDYNEIKDEFLTYHFNEYLKIVNSSDVEKVFSHLNRNDKKFLCASIENISKYFKQYNY